MRGFRGATWCQIAVVVGLLMAVGGALRSCMDADSEANSPLVRADFSDDAAWEALCKQAQAPYEDGFRAYLDCVDDRRFDGVTAERLVQSKGSLKNAGFAFIADRKALTDTEHPILVVDLSGKPGRSFRVIPSEMWAVENNLSLANADWEDFAEGAGPDGVYRGIRGP